jgi:hypothetical protein
MTRALGHTEGERRGGCVDYEGAHRARNAVYAFHVVPVLGFAACAVIWFGNTVVTGTPPTETQMGLGFLAFGTGVGIATASGAFAISCGVTTIEDFLPGRIPDLRYRTLIMGITAAWLWFLGTGILLLGMDRFFDLLDR